MYLRSSHCGSVETNPTIGAMRLQVRSLASHSGLRIWHCRELWCTSQNRSDPALLWLWQRPAVVALTWRPSLGTSIGHACGPQSKNSTTQPTLETVVIFPRILMINSQENATTEQCHHVLLREGSARPSRHAHSVLELPRAAECSAGRPRVPTRGGTPSTCVSPDPPHTLYVPSWS